MTIEEFKQGYATEIEFLMTHLEPSPESVEALLVDMLSDVIDVWVENIADSLAEE